MARSLSGLLDTLIIEKREAFNPTPPENYKSLFIHHFNERERIEHSVFGKGKLPLGRKYLTDNLNGEGVKDILREVQPDLLLTYGCRKLSPETLALVKGEKWNCHGGLSPWYKGVATHFWPSYMLEPQMTGMTVHDLTNDLDGGDIVHQCVAELHRGDGLHRLAARAVEKLAEELPTLIVREMVIRERAIEKKPQTTSGMLWRGSAWRPEHLKLIYETYDDRIVDAYLNGEFEEKEPQLYRSLT